MDNFEGYLKRSELKTNKVGFLIDMFKETHINAPEDDFDRLNGRMAGIYKYAKGDMVIIIKSIWRSCADSIQGSHLDYITKSVRACMKQSSKTQVKLSGHAGMETD